MTSKLRLATLHELQTVYSCEDLYDFLEILDVHAAVMDEQYKEQQARYNSK